MKPLTAEQKAYVDSLLAQMTLEEKVGQFNNPNAHDEQVTGGAGKVDNIEEAIRSGQVGTLGSGSFEERVKYQTIAINESRLGIPLMINRDVIHGDRAIFSTHMACSWNMNLIEKASHNAAAHARGELVHISWAPMGDVAEDQRWGRVSESGIESPHLMGRYVTSVVTGFQGDDLTQRDRVFAVAKHVGGYAFAKRGGDYKEVDMGGNKFHNSCMIPFLKASTADVGGYMLGFHALDRVPMTLHPAVGTILADHYGHDGMIATDYNAIQELVNHGAVTDLKEAAYQAFKFGRVTTDLVSQALVRHLPALVGEGRITAKEIDDRCRQILNMKVRLFWDDKLKKMNAQGELETVRDRSAAPLPAADRALSRQVAQESIVLLKNNGVLPLAKSARVAIVGPLGGGEEARHNMQGAWAVRAQPKDSVTLEEGMKAVGKGRVCFAKGSNFTNNATLAARFNVHSGPFPTCTIDSRSSKEMLAEARTVARKSDVIVLTIGEPKDSSGEAATLSDISIDPAQMKLARQMRKLADKEGKKLVIMVMSGRYNPMTEIEKMADALLFAGHPGTEGAMAAADILYGDVNPSGKTTMTIVRHPGQTPMTHEELPTGRPRGQIGVDIHGDLEAFKIVNGREIIVQYDDQEKLNADVAAGKVQRPFRKFTTSADQQNPDSPLFPMGYGIGYAAFEYGPATVNNAAPKSEDAIELSIKVKNTGTVAGKETVQLYKHQPAGKGRRNISHPMRELIGFDKKEIQPGEEIEFRFTVTKADLSFIYARDNGILKYETRFEPGRFILGAGPNAGNVSSTEINWRGSRAEITRPGHKKAEHCPK